MPFVLEEIFFFTSSGSRVRLSSTSQRIGIARANIMEVILAIKVYPGTITSSPGPIPNAHREVKSADVPELTARA